jgi:hypothetical protein
MDHKRLVKLWLEDIITLLNESPYKCTVKPIDQGFPKFWQLRANLGTQNLTWGPAKDKKSGGKRRQHPNGEKKHCAVDLWDWGLSVTGFNWKLESRLFSLYLFIFV